MIAYPKLNPGIIIIERDNNEKLEHNKVKENDAASIEFGNVMAEMSHYTDLKIDLDSIWNSDYEPFEEEGVVVIGLMMVRQMKIKILIIMMLAMNLL